ncbi:DUF418 domain-containing protein [Granulicoccus phenolivorans]|uniref:DUF418 domain-containing protein n=1 Tax=Granulicoccus phenolivorans TaxID=266854 RepID=UPI000409AB89|nr:DUF418 domain-containing protein [Granulicoccus phenolivorans]
MTAFPESASPESSVPDVRPAYTRELAPDLARGLMLLFIALANVPGFLYGRETGGLVRPLGGTRADQLVSVAGIIAIDGRIYPMFAFLFGVGMVQFRRSRLEHGVALPVVRRMLTDRHLWLIGFGAVHALLLFAGDILGTYGLCGLILMAALFERDNKQIGLFAAIYLGFLALYAGAVLAGGLTTPLTPELVAAARSTFAPVAEPSYPASMALRFQAWLSGTLTGALTTPIMPAILLGWIAARQGWLVQRRYRRLLIATAAIGIPVAWLGALPTALAHLGVLAAPAWAFSGLVALTGLAGGLGYVAGFALLGQRLQDRQSAPVRAVAALGQRSLSGYLFQSVIFAPLLSAWGLALGGWIGAAAAAGIALVTWLVSVLLAYALSRAGRRGPAEVLLRRLTYRRAR